MGLHRFLNSFAFYSFCRYNIKKMIVFVSKCAKIIGIEVTNKMNEVGEMIRQYRMKLGYSQKYLSEHYLPLNEVFDFRVMK